MGVGMKEYKRISFLIIIALLASYTVGCSQKIKKQPDDKIEMKEEYFGEGKNAFGNIAAPVDFDWKQCEGTVLNFLLEDNINANILSKEVEKFTEVTGIQVNIKCVDFNILVEKINMDFISKTAQYDLIYVDPYQTLNKFVDSLEDLNIYENDPDIPHIVGGLESFQEEHVEICSYFGNRDKLCAIPFDSTTMILFYRKDIFDKYGEEMERDLGYKPQPGSNTFTWEQYIETAKWISKNVPKEEIKYGSLSMSAKHNSIYTEFSNILAAYGGTYFNREGINTYGGTVTGEVESETEAFKKALTVYKEYANLEPSGEGGYNWAEVTEAFKKGEVAMMVNWDENAAALENVDESAVAGKVGYGILPFGDVKSACIYGGSGIGINSYADDREKLASWLFIVWATSPQVQMKAFLGDEGGNLPTRKNLLSLIEGRYMTNLPQAFSIIRALKKSYVYYRPKISNGYEFENIMMENLFQLVHEDKDVAETAKDIRLEWKKVLEDEQ